MAFIQVIECRTSKFEEIDKLDREWDRLTEGRRTLRRQIVGRDRTDPNRYVVLAFFDSYESAMENSQLPETSALAEKFASLVDGPMVFHDLDVIDERP